MFSHNWRVPFRFGHQTSEEQKQAVDVPDSGLGSSLDSSSMRSDQLSGSADEPEIQDEDIITQGTTYTLPSPQAGSVSGTTELVLRGDRDLPTSSGRKRKMDSVTDMLDRVKRKVIKSEMS